MPRYEYQLTRDGFRSSGKTLPEGMGIRVPDVSDAEQLASLMMDSYLGTIDYEGEDLDDARGEVNRYLEDESYLALSRVAEADGMIQAGALMSRIDGLPMIGYVMTRARMKNRGLASVLLDRVVAATWEAGHDDLRAFITAGNKPSEAIFTRAGFVVVAEYEG